MIKNDIILESLKSAIVLVDSDLTIQKVNIACETLFGTSRRYLIGKKLKQIIINEAVNTRIIDCIENQSQFTLREVKVNTPKAQTLVDVTLSCITSVESLSSLVLIELNEIDRISRFMKEKNQIERQQSFRLMMRGLAHEIKNPLGGIRGAAQLLHRSMTNSDDQELADILIKEADRLTKLVDRVMGSRKQLKQADLNIHEVINHVINVVSVKLENKIKVECDFDPALPEILADKEQLIQAILNIVGNALEAQKDSPEPIVGFVTKFERYITINQTMHRQALKLIVWDDGPGVPEELKNKLFDPLITGKAEGSGLGLSITQEIIQRHEGVVSLDEHNGRTCFSLYLPYRDSISKVGIL